MDKKLLEVNNLSITVSTNEAKKTIIEAISYNLYANEILGIVGESGSGKSVSSLAILGLLPKQIFKITSGQILFKNQNLCETSNTDFQKIRGKQIAMIFQEPMSSLNPSMRCGKQVVEVLKKHTSHTATEIKNKVLTLFEQVKLPNPERVFKAYPHEISGGQKQRVMIAMALACEPDILIADEPTTALDVTVQKEIILLLKEIQAKTKMSIIFITHDLALISEIANRVLVMYQGKIVEQGTVTNVFKNPQHNYTKALLQARPILSKRFRELPTIKKVLNKTVSYEIITASQRKKHHELIYNKAPLLEVIDIEKTYINKTGWFNKEETFKAVNGVSFKLYEGETLGLVGESGCGKSTLGNAILQLDKATSGKIMYKGKNLVALSQSEMKVFRKDIQIIFQDPYASLNPRLTVGEAIMEPMQVHQVYKTKKERKAKTLQLLEQVGLPPDAFFKYPNAFSGGQRQRIGIARTIALQPKIIICDESVSALDISVQAQVLNLLNHLKDSFGFTYIFISHDLSVVKYMSDRLAVMHQGKLVEFGEADTIYAQPKTAYTQQLIAAIPKGL